VDILLNVSPLFSAMLAGICGAIIGSYIGVIVLRWPRAEQTVAGRSMCDACGRPLSWYEMLPLLSWLALRGRCAQCRSPIDRVQPISEMLGAAIGFSTFLLLPLTAAFACSALLLLLLPIALLDARHFWLPDRLTIALAAAGAIAGSVTSGGSDLGVRLIGAGLSYLLLEGLRRGYMLLRQREGMGAGDPKLAAAIALWCAPLDLPLLLLAAAAVGLGLALFATLRGRDVTRLPFGTCLALAVPLLLFDQSLPYWL
jgi:leader peptidase (prepilin peptidase)/N-methyltransferase